MSNNIAKVATLIGDPSRSLMLLALLGGRALTASELAGQANISASTASGHLAQLLEQKMVACHQQGRHRYYFLADEAVADILEKLLNFSNAEIPFNGSSAPERLHNARSCYKHLAGALAVELKQAMERMGHIYCERGSIRLTDKGLQYLIGLGVSDTIYMGSKADLKLCMDWSERQFHMAGPLANILLEFFLQAQWLIQVEGSPRELRITQKGKKNFLLGWKISTLG